MTETFKFKDLYLGIGKAQSVAGEQYEENGVEMMQEERAAIENGTSELFSTPSLSSVVEKIKNGDFALIFSTFAEGLYEEFGYTMPKWMLESGACYILGWLFYLNGYKAKRIDFSRYIVSKGETEIVIAEGNDVAWMLCEESVAEEIVRMTAEVPVSEEEYYDEGCVELRKSILDYETNNEVGCINGDWIEESFEEMEEE